MKTNALTIDVEDYFQVSALAPYIDRAEWDTRSCRVERNLARILEMLDRHDVKATFFTLGWIAERYPGVVRDIIAGGHELASHGYGHQRATELGPEAFFEDIRRAKAILEGLAGEEVKGYRAPSFSVDARNRAWVCDALVRAGYRYSSSVYPVRHDHYGMPEAPRFAHAPQVNLLEVPPTTVRFFKRNWPAGGGGYFRLLPYAVSRRLIAHVNRRDDAPAVFYFHPWEIDVEQPRIADIGLKTRFRHYVNLARMERRLERLLGDFRWGRMDHIFLGS